MTGPGTDRRRRGSGTIGRMTTDGLTYPEVGATAGALPPGYDHVRRTAVLGRGTATFDRAADAVMAWDLHRRAGLRVDADSARATLGTTVRLGVGIGPLRVTAPCRVVRVVDEVTARGFAYGTLPGHPEQGEESFIVRRDAAGTVTLEILAFSRPAQWWSRLGAPVTRLAQQHLTTRYLDALVER